MCLAGTLGSELRKAYLADDRFDPHVTNIPADLGRVSEEIFMATNGDQATVVEILGLDDVDLWPPAMGFAPHFCTYSVLARLTREQLFENAFSLNYDCGYEAGLHGEGFLLAPDVRPGRVFSDHVTVTADHRGATANDDKGSFQLRKIHGCAQRYRVEKNLHPEDHPEDAIIVRSTQLQNWQGRDWSKQLLLSAARQSVLMLIGFSANDANVVGVLTELLDEVYTAQTPTGKPRVVVINHSPSTPELRALTFRGRGKVPADPGAVDHVATSAGTTTAALLVLLTEALGHLLSGPFDMENYKLPDRLGWAGASGHRA